MAKKVHYHQDQLYVTDPININYISKSEPKYHRRKKGHKERKTSGTNLINFDKEQANHDWKCLSCLYHPHN